MSTADQSHYSGIGSRPVWTRFWSDYPLDTAAVAFWISILSFLGSFSLNQGPLSVLLSITGIAACGFSWLFARAVFRPDAGRETWPLIVVGVLIVTGIPLHLFGPAETGTGPLATSLGMASSLHSLISSTVLFLALLEALWGYRADLPGKEKRFRLIYAAGYGAMITVSVIWLRGAPNGSWADRSGDMVRLTCAILALGASIIVWRYRRAHPHPKAKRRQRIVSSVSADDIDLLERIRGRMQSDRLYLEPDLKLADLAHSLCEPEHKVRNCITGALGFRNFNHMVNHYRIDAAKAVLRSGDDRSRNILNVALDCGFSSIGPFNRAFKEETGQTPSAYRQSEKVVAEA